MEKNNDSKQEDLRTEADLETQGYFEWLKDKEGFEQRHLNLSKIKNPNVNVFGWDEKKTQLISGFITQQYESMVEAQRTGKFPKYVGRDNIDELIDGLNELAYNISVLVTDQADTNDQEKIARQYEEILYKKQKALNADLNSIDAAFKVLYSQFPGLELPF